jgi:hypothetical protein
MRMRKYLDQGISQEDRISPLFREIYPLWSRIHYGITISILRDEEVSIRRYPTQSALYQVICLRVQYYRMKLERWWCSLPIPQ